MNNVCPNGYICINHSNAIIIILLTVSIFYLVNNDSYKKIFTKVSMLSHQPIPDLNDNEFNNSVVQTNNESINHNTKVISDPLYPPLKRGIPINIETRESGGDYQQLGILSKNKITDDAETPGNNTDSVVLPLYGKPLYRGATKWLYYTETDKYNPVKIPISVKNKDCTDDYGCDEVYDNDDVVIPAYNGTFNVKIYKLNKPRYIPY